jgi:DNA-binding NarL/FixJ family response regulator
LEKTAKIRVFLSEPQVLFREGIHFVLSGEDDFEVTGETTGNEEAYSLIEANPPNIAILSAYDVKAGGFDISRRIHRNLPSVYVILTMDKKIPEQTFLAIKSGASACLTKDIDPERLLDVIRVVAQGSLLIMEEIFNPTLASLILADFQDVATLNEHFENLLADLSPKELQLLNSIVAGNNIEQIAAKLEMNEESIRHNMRLILNKLASNEQARTVIETAQRNLSSMLSVDLLSGKPATEYLTRQEFNEFKESLTRHISMLLGEPALQSRKVGSAEGHSITTSTQKQEVRGGK